MFQMCIRTLTSFNIPSQQGQKSSDLSPTPSLSHVGGRGCPTSCYSALLRCPTRCVDRHVASWLRDGRLTALHQDRQQPFRGAKAQVLVLGSRSDPDNLSSRMHRTTVQPFENGFIGFDRRQIREFIAQHLPSVPAGTSLEPDRYALLDRPSISDSTVVLGISCSGLHDRDTETMTEEESEQWWEACEEHPESPKDLWREFRVQFGEAERLATILTFESDFTQKLYNDDFVAAHTGNRGVFLLEQAWLAYLASHRSDDNE